MIYEFYFSLILLYYSISACVCVCIYADSILFMQPVSVCMQTAYVCMQCVHVMCVFSQYAYACMQPHVCMQMECTSRQTVCMYVYMLSICVYVCMEAVCVTK